MTKLTKAELVAEGKNLGLNLSMSSKWDELNDAVNNAKKKAPKAKASKAKASGEK